jgi:hypothetical protein
MEEEMDNEILEEPNDEWGPRDRIIPRQSIIFSYVSVVSLIESVHKNGGLLFLDHLLVLDNQI